MVDGAGAHASGRTAAARSSPESHSGVRHSSARSFFSPLHCGEGSNRERLGRVSRLRPCAPNAPTHPPGVACQLPAVRLARGRRRLTPACARAVSQSAKSVASAGVAQTQPRAHRVHPAACVASRHRAADCASAGACAAGASDQAAAPPSGQLSAPSSNGAHSASSSTSAWSSNMPSSGHSSSAAMRGRGVSGTVVPCHASGEAARGGAALASSLQRSSREVDAGGTPHGTRRGARVEVVPPACFAVRNACCSATQRAGLKESVLFFRSARACAE